MWWLKKIEIDSLTAPEARSPNKGVYRAGLPPEALGGSRCSWVGAPSLQSLPPSVWTSPPPPLCVFLTKTLVTAFRALPDNPGWAHLKTLSSVTSVKTLFPFFSFWLIFSPHQMACRILVPQPGIKPAPPALEVQSLNHWTAREVLTLSPNKEVHNHRVCWFFFFLIFILYWSRVE